MSEKFQFVRWRGGSHFTNTSLSLASTPVSAATCSTLSVNLLSRNRARIYDVNDARGIVDLPITVSFLSQERTTSFSFVVVDKDFAFEILLGSQWEVSTKV